MKLNKIFIFFLLFFLFATSLFAQSTKGYIFIDRMANSGVKSNAGDLLKKVISDEQSIKLSCSSIDMVNSTVINKEVITEVIISNTGNEAKSLNINLTGDNTFSIYSNTCSNTLAGDSSCKVTIKFLPQDQQLHTAILAVNNQNIPIKGQATNSNFCGGSGTQDDPYLICNVYQLQHACSANYVALAKDIDARVTQLPGKHFQPIDCSHGNIAFHFDGRGHTIKNIYIYPKGNLNIAAIFALLRNAVIKNLKIENAFVRASASSAAAILVGIQGNNRHHANISNISITGKIIASGVFRVGSIAVVLGDYSTIKNCNVNVDMEIKPDNNAEIGGLLSYFTNSRGTVRDSSVTANINVYSSNFYYAGPICSYSNSNKCGNIIDTNTNVNIVKKNYYDWPY